MKIAPKAILPLLLAVLLVPLSGVIGIAAWKKKKAVSRTEAFLKAVVEVKNSSGANDALTLLVRHSPIEIPPGIEPQIKKLRQDLINESGNVAQLNALIRTDPDVLEENEDLALLRCRQYLSEGQPDKVEILHKKWESKGVKKEDWYLISIAAQSDRKKPEETIKRLDEAEKLGVAPEKLLLNRAVFAAAQEGDEAAWKLLLEAYEKNPSDWELRVFMGNFLEKKGKLQEAQREYVAAVLVSPDNLLARDRLASFYLRYGRIGSAMQTWKEAPNGKLPGYLWVRLYFWSRMYHSVDMPELELTGISTAYARLLRKIPEDKFWTEAANSRSKQLPDLAEHSAQIFWFKLIDFIQKGKKKEASDLLLAPPTLAKIGQPHLLGSLKFLLALQLKSECDTSPAYSLVPATQSGQHPFFTWLHEWKTSQNDASLVCFCQSDNAYAAAFMAEGWTRAAVSLLQVPASRKKGNQDLPGWFAYGIAKCLRHCEGAPKAAQWLDELTSDAPGSPAPELVVLRAELDLETGKIEEGVARLETIRKLDCDAGEQAATLLILRQMEANQLDEADRLHREQPRFAGNQQGAELLARIAIARGDLASARQIFDPWKETSAEAALFFAKQAFDSGDFATAREITQRLAEAMPLNLYLQENLKSIREAEQKATEGRG